MAIWQDLVDRMLRKDCFQSAHFFTQPLALCKCTLQSGSKIALIRHEGALSNHSKGLAMFWIDCQKPFQPGNLPKYRIGGNKMIHPFLIPQFQRHGKLESVQGT
jgi:hypothetical protein